MSGRTYAARRPAPRRVRRRGGPSRVRWDRIGRVALVLVLFGVLVSYLNPLVNLADAWRDSKAGEERLLELKGENAGLRAQVELELDAFTLELGSKLMKRRRRSCAIDRVPAREVGRADDLRDALLRERRRERDRSRRLGRPVVEAGQ